MLMLIPILFCVCEAASYLNTSNVNVNPWSSLKQAYTLRNLNTSNVNVNL